MSEIYKTSPLNKFIINLDTFGKQEIDLQEYAGISGPYEEEMRKQASIVAYLEALCAECEFKLSELEDNLKTIKGERMEHYVAEAKESGEKKTVAQIGALIDTDPQVILQLEQIRETKRVVKKLKGGLVALAQKKSMLKQLAMHERYGLTLNSGFVEDEEELLREKLNNRKLNKD